MHWRCGIILGLLLLMPIGLAQDHDMVPQTLTIGDSVEVTLEPQEQQVYELDIARGDSFFKRVTIDGEPHSGIGTRIFTPDDGGEVYVAGGGRYVVTEDGAYMLELTNSEKTTATIRLELASVPVREITVGDRYIIAEDDPDVFELVFTITEQQPVRVASNGAYFSASRPPTYLSYSLERFRGERLGMINPGTTRSVFSRTLEPGSYRFVVSQATPLAGEPPATEIGYIELLSTRVVGGELSVGEFARTSANVQPVQFMVELAEGETFHALVVSTGVQAYILDQNGDWQTSYGHGAGRYAYVPLEMVAPADGTYTVHIYDPSRMDGVVGDVIITTRHGGKHTHDLENGITLDFAASDTHTISCWTCRVLLTTADGEPLDGAIQIEVVQPPDPSFGGAITTVLETEMRDTAEFEFKVESTYPGALVLLHSTDGVNTEINAIFEPVEEN